MNQIQINFKELAIDTYKHKRTGQLMTIQTMHGEKIATCKLAEPFYIRNPIKMLIDITICNINNLEKIDGGTEV